MDLVFRDALHHALYAERLADVMRDYSELLSIETKDVPAGRRAKVGVQKMHAQKQLELIREALGLDG